MNVDRLAHKICHAGLPGQILGAVNRCDRDDRHLLESGNRADGTRGVEPIEFRHHNIHQDQSRPVGCRPRDCLPTIRRLDHVIAECAQQGTQRLAAVVVILDNQDLGWSNTELLLNYGHCFYAFERPKALLLTDFRSDKGASSGPGVCSMSTRRNENTGMREGAKDPQTADSWELVVSEEVTAARRFTHDGGEWIAWASGGGAYGTGALGAAAVEAVHFARASDPAVPLFEALLPAGRFIGLYDDELINLFRAAVRVVDVSELPEPPIRRRSGLLEGRVAPGTQADESERGKRR